MTLFLTISLLFVSAILLFKLNDMNYFTKSFQRNKKINNLFSGIPAHCITIRDFDDYKNLFLMGLNLKF